MKDRLTQLAIRVLDAKAERRRVAEARCLISADDESAMLESDDACEAARAKLEAAHREFFQHWIDLEIAEGFAYDTVTQTGVSE
jgi:hypothetical protein